MCSFSYPNYNPEKGINKSVPVGMGVYSLVPLSLGTLHIQQSQRMSSVRTEELQSVFQNIPMNVVHRSTSSRSAMVLAFVVLLLSI